jgi:hypothetical protein
LFLNIENLDYEAKDFDKGGMKFKNGDNKTFTQIAGRTGRILTLSGDESTEFIIPKILRGNMLWMQVELTQNLDYSIEN